MDCTKDLLLIAPDTPSCEERENENAIILAALSCGYSVDVVSESECPDYLSAYPNVIYLPGTLGRSIAKNTGRALVLGTMTEYMISALQCSAEVKVVENGRVTYTDSGISEPGDLSECLVFDGTNYESGIISFGEESVPLVSGIGRVRYIQMTDYRGALAGTVLMRQVRSLFPKNSLYDSGLLRRSNYLVLTGACAERLDNLQTAIDLFASRNAHYVIGFLPEESSCLSSEYVDALVLAQQRGAGIALDLSQAGDSLPEQDQILSYVRQLAEKKIYLSALIVDSSQLFLPDVTNRLPSSLLIVNGDSSFHDKDPEEIIALSDQLLFCGKQLLLPARMYGSGSYENGSCGFAACIGLDLPEDSLRQRCQSAMTSHMRFSDISTDSMANLYRGDRTFDPVQVHRSAEQKPTLADLADRVLSSRKNGLLAGAAFILLAVLLGRLFRTTPCGKAG